jgi:choline dehydrogenase-like flavoprotein
MSDALRLAIAAATPERLEASHDIDAVVVGAGAAGGMAAMRLTEAGLKVLVLDAGRTQSFLEAPVRKLLCGAVAAIASERLNALLPSRIALLGRRGLRLAGLFDQPVQSRCFGWVLDPEAFVSDRSAPYVVEPGSRFDWFRIHGLGGRMTAPGHGRQYYRLGEQDLNPDDGLSPPWPLERGELDAWYDLVEGLLGLSGGDESCAWTPGGRMARVLTPSPDEADAAARIRSRWPQVQPILGRYAPPLSSLDAAAATGRLLCRQGARVRNVEVDDSGHVAGVAWRDGAAGVLMSVRAPIVFLCASALESTRILLSSGSAAAPDGLGVRSGALGRYLMDHLTLSGEGIGAELPGGSMAPEIGRCLYLPRFDLSQREVPGARGSGVQIYRGPLPRGRSSFKAVAFQEMAPRPENRVSLDPEMTDAFGDPMLRIACRHSPAELRMAKQGALALRELGETLDVRFDRLDTHPAPPGTAIHECGTARMGASPLSSVLDPHNQCWDAGGLYVTDAACFPSQGVQNPTLTIMALTARACDHAIRAVRLKPRRGRLLTAAE